MSSAQNFPAVHPAFAASLQRHNALMQLPTYLANPAVRSHTVWGPWKNGRRMVRMLPPPGHVPGPDDPEAPYAELTIIGVVSDNLPALGSLGNHNPNSQYPKALCNAKYTMQVKPPVNDPVFLQSHAAAMSGVEAFEHEVCGTANHIRSDDDGVISLRVGQHVFEKKARGSSSDVDPHRVFVPEASRAAYEETLKTHDLRLLVVWDPQGRRVPADLIQELLPGSLAQFLVRLVYFKIYNRGKVTHAMNAELVQLDVIRWAPPPPPRQLRANGPFVHPNTVNGNSAAGQGVPSFTQSGPFPQAAFGGPSYASGATTTAYQQHPNGYSPTADANANIVPHMQAGASPMSAHPAPWPHPAYGGPSNGRGGETAARQQPLIAATSNYPVAYGQTHTTQHGAPSTSTHQALTAHVHPGPSKDGYAVTPSNYGGPAVYGNGPSRSFGPAGPALAGEGTKTTQTEVTGGPSRYTPTLPKVTDWSPDARRLLAGVKFTEGPLKGQPVLGYVEPVLQSHVGDTTTPHDPPTAAHAGSAQGHWPSGNPGYMTNDYSAEAPAPGSMTNGAGVLSPSTPISRGPYVPFNNVSQWYANSAFERPSTATHGNAYAPAFNAGSLGPWTANSVPTGGAETQTTGRPHEQQQQLFSAPSTPAQSHEQHMHSVPSTPAGQRPDGSAIRPSTLQSPISTVAPTMGAYTIAPVPSSFTPNNFTEPRRMTPASTPAQSTPVISVTPADEQRHVAPAYVQSTQSGITTQGAENREPLFLPGSPTSAVNLNDSRAETPQSMPSLEDQEGPPTWQSVTPMWVGMYGDVAQSFEIQRDGDSAGSSGASSSSGDAFMARHGAIDPVLTYAYSSASEEEEGGLVGYRRKRDAKGKRRATFESDEEESRRAARLRYDDSDGT
ncbi:hypothetical protein B0H15DRAFT_798652 [Mycena belliarum]|uniref:Uncharacterized protein n=1 Tax=Mycena belliarum TaxID=1033014 RepID=A0AAD6UAD4_9AGAR|nr:hypothetical protein B0H15DRAFT_798652 [Mycena belliae]